MKKITKILAALLMILFCCQAAFAKNEAAKMSKGEQLERMMWQYIKGGKWDKIENMIAPAFQSSHSDGARTKKLEMKLIRGLRVHKYEISKFKTTRHGDVIVVTYFISVEETIEGKRLSKKPAARMSVWIKNKGKWQWIAHANLKPL